MKKQVTFVGDVLNTKHDVGIKRPPAQTLK
jgi:hypothetical protein